MLTHPSELIFDEQTDDAAATARKYCRENNCEANVESFARDEILRTVAHADRKRVPVGVDSAAAPSLPHTPKMDSDRRSLRRQFIILSSQRCGSNWLGARLHWHTELAIGGEIQPLIKRARATRLAGAGMPGEDSADDDDDYEMQSFATVDSVDAGDDEYDGVDVDYGNEDLTAQEDDDGPARDGAHATMRVIQRALAHALENNASGPSNSHDNSVYGVKNVAGVRAVGVLRRGPPPPTSIAKGGVARHFDWGVCGSRNSIRTSARTHRMSRRSLEGSRELNRRRHGYERSTTRRGWSTSCERTDLSR